MIATIATIVAIAAIATITEKVNEDRGHLRLTTSFALFAKFNMAAFNRRFLTLEKERTEGAEHPRPQVVARCSETHFLHKQ